ncbi:unnamed protein product [Darwinula stevensoni]|uniref:Regulator of microtubule dynamics protein 1 n=1 Tax=Darwinula stevensoni TaxID=69355 RepID=A0A7R8XDJ3_9CRUS|nr:unnamed protein product [Darwinula stevensoni]CAG0894819.1 unnamed protein product [Darwinula stevensoni]
MNSSSEKIHLLGLLTALGAGIILGAGSMYLYFERRKQDAMQQLLEEMKESIFSLSQDLLDLREKARRRLPQVSSVATDLYSFYSAESELSIGETDESGDDEVRLKRPDAGFIESSTPVIRRKKKYTRTDKLLSGDTQNIHSAYSHLKSIEPECTNDPEFYWRLAKACHLRATHEEEQGRPDRMKVFIFEGIEAAEKGLGIDNRDPELHKWYAILVGSRGQFSSTKERIKDGYLFQQHVDLALRASPNDPVLHHLKGRFCYEVSQLSFIERSVASTLFAAPPTATVEESLASLMEAERLFENPWKENKLYIAKCHIGSREFALAAKHLKEGLAMPSTSPRDAGVHAELESLFKKVETCTAYALKDLGSGRYRYSLGNSRSPEDPDPDPGSGIPRTVAKEAIMKGFSPRNPALDNEWLDNEPENSGFWIRDEASGIAVRVGGCGNPGYYVCEFPDPWGGVWRQ